MQILSYTGGRICMYLLDTVNNRNSIDTCKSFPILADGWTQKDEHTERETGRQRHHWGDWMKQVTSCFGGAGNEHKGPSRFSTARFGETEQPTQKHGRLFLFPSCLGSVQRGVRGIGKWSLVHTLVRCGNQRHDLVSKFFLFRFQNLDTYMALFVQA